MEQLDEFKKYKNKFVQSEIQKNWILALKQVEQDYNKWMNSSNLKRKLFLGVRKYFLYMFNFQSYIFTFCSRLKNKSKNLIILIAKCE